MLFYFKYFKEEPKISDRTKLIKEIDVNINSSSNYVDNITYNSSDTKGNKYQIIAVQAEIDNNNPDIMFLENITSYIFMNDSTTIKITSDYGKYNSKNYDTIYSKNVIITYPGHKIIGEYLDFSFLDDLGTMSTNVIYFGNDLKLFADRLEMTISTKDAKIFMHDNITKVLTEGKR